MRDTDTFEMAADLELDLQYKLGQLHQSMGFALLVWKGGESGARDWERYREKDTEVPTC